MDYIFTTKSIPITYNLHLKNMGIIKDANIEFGGLTVIAGENDTGKSTVGKMIYSIIKSISKYDDLELGDMEKINMLGEIITKLYFSLPRGMNDMRTIEKIRNIRKKIEMAYENKSLEYIDTILIDLNELYKMVKLQLYVCKMDSVGQVKLFCPNNTVSSSEATLDEEDLELLNFIKDSINQIDKILKKEESRENTIKRAFGRIINSEFNSSVSNKIFKNESIIGIYAGDKIVEFKLKDNKLKNIVLNEDELYYNDAVYIESPIVLHIHHAIKYSDVSFGLSKRKFYRGGIVPFHLKDLIGKLEISKNIALPDIYGEEEPKNPMQELYDEIYNIINGEIIYSDGSADFEYVKNINNKKCSIRSINTATGIKSFGIIQLLIKSGILTDSTVLIIDEPEVHLHPEWQLKYAHIMVKLVKYGIPVVISSHSPYMIQALRYYSVKEEIDDISKYYLAEKDENELVEIKDVGDDLNKVFQKLAKPLGKVM